MRCRRTMLAAMAALTLGTTMGPVPASAQDFDEEYGPDAYDDVYERRRFRRYGGGGQGDSVCVTARGNCVVPPAPYNAPCGCMIPGFGPKRGQIGG